MRVLSPFPEGQGLHNFGWTGETTQTQATVVCHGTQEIKHTDGCVFVHRSEVTEPKHSKQTLLSFFGHEGEREKRPGDFLSNLTGEKSSVENNEGVLSGEGGSDSSLPSQNRLRTYYLCPKHILLVATVDPPAQELEDIDSLTGKSFCGLPSNVADTC